MADSLQLSLYVTLFGGAVAVASITALAALTLRSTAFKRNIREVLEGLGNGSQLNEFTDETGAYLQQLFSKVPALAFCYQTYAQALIPPQAPYERFYRSGREAIYSFDRDFILKNALGLRIFQALPAVIVALGALGTMIGFAACLSSTQALLTTSNPTDLSGLAKQLFEVGGKSFWPAGVGIFGGLLLLIFERVQTSQCGEMIQALAMILDAGMSPKTIEQIASHSHTELRDTHLAITDFTKGFFQNLGAEMLKIVSKNGNMTVDEVLEQNAKAHLTPLYDELMGARLEAKVAAETAQKAFNQKISALESAVSEILAMNKANETDADKESTVFFDTTQVNNIKLRPERSRNIESELISKLHAQAELTQNILLEIRDSSSLMSSDLHKTSKIIEEVVTPDLGRQSKLLQDINDRVAMQGNKLTESMLSVGEDLANRVDLVSTVLVGNETSEDSELNAFIQEIQGQIAQNSPEKTYANLREKVAGFTVDRRVKEGDARRSEDRVEGTADARIETSQGLLGRISELQSSLSKQREATANDTAAVGSALASTLGEHIKSQEDVIQKDIEKSNAKIHKDVEYLSKKIDAITEKIEQRLESIGKRVGSRLAEFGDRVTEELEIIGDDVDNIANDSHKIDLIARDLQDLSVFLEEIPLSAMNVVQNRRQSREQPLTRPMRRREALVKTARTGRRSSDSEIPKTRKAASTSIRRSPRRAS